MDTLGDLESQGTGVNPEIEVMIKEEEEEEEEEYGGQATGGSGGVASQDFFLTPEQSSQSQQSSPGEPDAGEGTSAAANAALRASPSTPEERLGQVRRRKKRTREDMFQEVLRASRASEREQRAWRVMINDKMQRDSEDRRNGQQEMITLLREQTDMLRSLIELQAEHIRARLPLQPIENCIPGPPFTGLHRLDRDFMIESPQEEIIETTLSEAREADFRVPSGIFLSLPPPTVVSGTQAEPGSYPQHPEPGSDSLPRDRVRRESEDRGLVTSIDKCHLPPATVQTNPDPAGAPDQGQGGGRGGESPE
ncbi:unnamed protein product [Caretta caretta]